MSEEEEESNFKKSALTKEQIDIALELAKRAQDRFQARRSYDWKLCFGLWAALGAASSFALSPHEAAIPTELKAYAIIGAVILVAASLFWQHGFFTASERDKRTSFWWESQVERNMGILLPKVLWPDGYERAKNIGKDLLTDLDVVEMNGAPRRNFLFDWAHSTQFAITLVLAGLFAVSVARTPSISNAPSNSVAISSTVPQAVTVQPATRPWTVPAP